MLKMAIEAAAAEGRAMRVVTPTKKAADVAAQELDIPADSVAALVYAHGFRWNSDGVWTRLRPGDVDTETGAIYRGLVQGRVSREVSGSSSTRQGCSTKTPPSPCCTSRTRPG